MHTLIGLAVLAAFVFTFVMVARSNKPGDVTPSRTIDPIPPKK